MLASVPRAPLARVTKPPDVIPGAARPDGRLHLTTFLPRLRREQPTPVANSS